MIHIAIVEDEAAERANIKNKLQQYSEEKHVEITTSEFENPITFLSGYKHVYDIVFLDIQMKHMDGMTAAEKLRELDAEVPLVFITNMAGMAVRGYSVDAMDFIVKPIVYGSFSAMLSKAIRRIDAKSESILIKTPEGKVRLEISKIFYVDISGHKVVYHTEDGEYNCWGSLKEQLEILPEKKFAMCNNYCILNLKYVTEFNSKTVFAGGMEFSLTRTKKKEFTDRMTAFYGEMV